MKNNLLAKRFYAPVLIGLLGLMLGQASAQTTIIDPAGAGGFELGTDFPTNGWTLVNGVGVTNQWFVGTVPTLFGTKSAYVSDSPTGATHTYTVTAGSLVHFYRDITFPAGESDITFSFQWYCGGESSFDYLQVSIGPTSIVPVASNSVTTGNPLLTPTIPGTTVIGGFNLFPTPVQTFTTKLPPNLIGNCTGTVTLRLFFTWRNDSSVGTQPPAAVDNISLISAVPLAPLAAGTYTVGPTGTYTTLGTATADVNSRGVTGPVILELQTTYTSAGETFPITLAGQANCNPLTSVNTATIRPALGSPTLTIAGTNAGPTIDINNGNWWRIDGRPGGVGTTKGLVISNSSITGQAIRFINDASNNIVQYCDVKGVNTSTVNGVILFSTTTFSSGNDNNLIDNCDVHDGATTPTNCILSLGTATSQNLFNRNNTVSNCNIFNHFTATASTASNGILVTTGSTEWTITGNSFYQTASRVLPTAIFADLQCPLTISNYFVITNNFFGGTAPLCGGGPLTLTGTGNLRSVNMTVGPGTSLVQGNTVQNISFTSSNTSAFSGALLLGQGNFLCNANNIGSLTVNNSIVMTSSGSLSAYRAIAVGGTSPTNTSTVSNNNIGGISVVTSGAPATQPSLQAILLTGTTAGSNHIATLNTIGSTTLANSLTCNSNVVGSVIGIFSASNALGQQITNNTISNLTGTSTGTSNILWGILAQGSTNVGTYTVTGNTLQDLTLGSGNILNFSLTGIQVSNSASTAGSNIVEQNTVRNLLQNNPTAGATIAGILVALQTSTSNLIARNSIHSLNMTSSTLTGSTIGIVMAGGTSNVQNNMIRLGVSDAGVDITSGYGMTGILEQLGNNNIRFNSVYVGGAGVSAGTSNTFAFNSVVTTGVRNYISNIFYNARSNGAGTGKHYAIAFGGTTPNPAGVQPYPEQR